MNTSNKSKAYGWIHNLNHYWYNKYYFYYTGDSNHPENYQNWNGCTVPSNNLEINLHGFSIGPPNNPFLYELEFYPTRIGTESSLPDNAIVTCDNSTNIDIGPVINGYLGCDTNNADFAFKIYKTSNYRINGNNGINNFYATTDTIIKKTTFFQKDTVQSIIPEINITPNPSLGIFKIDFKRIVSNQMEISIYNSIGSPISFEQVNNSSSILIDLSQKPIGIYFLKISYNGVNKFFKLVLS